VQTEPEKAAAGVAGWVEQVREVREARMKREEERRMKKMRGWRQKVIRKRMVLCPLIIHLQAVL
jgi:hypothetical protein